MVEEIVGQAIDPPVATGSKAKYGIYHLCPLPVILDSPCLTQHFCCSKLLVW